MQFLALLTLNILLFTNFIQSRAHPKKDPHSNLNQNTVVHTTEQSTVNERINSKVDVLGSYVISYDAVTKNAQSRSQNEPQENDTHNSQVTEAIIVPVNDPTKNDFDMNDKEIEVLETPNNATALMNKINWYRSQNGLSDFSYNEVVCNFASLRANELQSEFSHTGFRSKIDNNTLPYSDYSHIAENIADTSSPNKAFELWRNSSGHNANMLTSATYGCIGNTGRLYTLEVWQP
ncbi:CAP domain-containing protein [Candidatus Woesebacteria bacterium]|nr:CAP domain-containing protein [Candidatus Woesebacteria bacterium]